MPLATDPLPRDTMNLLAAVTSGRRARNPHARRDWLRVSQRLACGLTPRQVARAERTDEAAIDALLAQTGFRALVG
jgi:predicted component of type VI protein secretion system